MSIASDDPEEPNAQVKLSGTGHYFTRSCDDDSDDEGRRSYQSAWKRFFT